MLSQHIIIDSLTRVTPFGVRFYDRVTKQSITELTVTARATTGLSHARSMVPNSSGVYMLQHVPGLRDFEYGAGDAAFWAHMPPPQRYAIAVSDPRERFLAFTFEADIPTKGLFVWNCAPGVSPAEPDSGDVPLFSTARRPFPAGYTAVRADLYDPIANQPAAWAIVDVSYQGRRLGRGIADARGCVSVPLAYPPPVDFEPLSPPVPGAPLTGQTWRIELQVWYAPQAFTIQPDLCTLFEQLNSPPARVWGIWHSPSGTDWLTEAVIVYGRELVLRTNEGGSPLPRLYIAPAV